MKKIFLLCITCSFYIHICNAQQGTEALFGLNDSAYIKVIAGQVVDTITFYTEKCSLTPLRGRNLKKTIFTHAGSVLISYPADKPEMIWFVSDSMHQVYIIPKDTVVIHVGSVYNQDKKRIINFKPEGPIQEYIQAKKLKFGFYSITSANNLYFKGFPAMGLSLNQYSRVVKTMDSLVSVNNQFLEENSSKLPAWYIETEKADNIYGAELINMSFFNKLNEETRKKIFYAEPEMNSHTVLYSNSFYEFLDNYLLNKATGLVYKNYFDFKINLLNSYKSKLDSLLNRDVKDKYVLYKLSDLYFMSLNKEEIKKADAFIASNFPSLTAEQLKFINSEKNKNKTSLLTKGSQAPGFYLKDLEDKFVRLSDFKGKLVCLHFWYAGSEPCKEEIPALNKLYTKLKGKTVEIIHICLDGDIEKWKKVIEKEKLKGINLICKGNWEEKLKESYLIEDIPHYTLVDANGMLISNQCKSPSGIEEEIFQILNKLK
jgi:peroxiredoxin